MSVSAHFHILKKDEAYGHVADFSLLTEEWAHKAVTNALESAANKARTLAAEEAKQVCHLVTQALDLQMQLLHQRMQSFKNLQNAVEGDQMTSKVIADLQIAPDRADSKEFAKPRNSWTSVSS